jgi:DNA-binding NtrC family response regulator
MPRILLVDDDPSVLSALRRALRNGMADVEVEVFEEPALALARARESGFDLVISDYRMPSMDGVAFLNKFRKIQPTCPRMILSAQADFNALVEAINSARIVRFISKPWDNAHLIACAEAALALHERVREQVRVKAERASVPDVAISGEIELLSQENFSPELSTVDWNADGSISLEALGRLGSSSTQAGKVNPRQS